MEYLTSSANSSPQPRFSQQLESITASINAAERGDLHACLMNGSAASLKFPFDDQQELFERFQQQSHQFHTYLQSRDSPHNVHPYLSDCSSSLNFEPLRANSTMPKPPPSSPSLLPSLASFTQLNAPQRQISSPVGAQADAISSGYIDAEFDGIASPQEAITTCHIQGYLEGLGMRTVISIGGRKFNGFVVNESLGTVRIQELEKLVKAGNKLILDDIQMRRTNQDDGIQCDTQSQHLPPVPFQPQSLFHDTQQHPQRAS